MRQVWRSDLDTRGEIPTECCVVIHAEDFLRAKNEDGLAICHVESFDGKGFLPTVRVQDTFINGKVFLGIDGMAYIRAIASGKVMLRKASKLTKNQLKLLGTTEEVNSD
jgi:hypothetical protein